MSNNITKTMATKRNKSGSKPTAIKTVREKTNGSLSKTDLSRMGSDLAAVKQERRRGIVREMEKLNSCLFDAFRQIFSIGEELQKMAELRLQPDGVTPEPSELTPKEMAACRKLWEICFRYNIEDPTNTDIGRAQLELFGLYGNEVEPSINTASWAKFKAA